MPLGSREFEDIIMLSLTENKFGGPYRGRGSDTDRAIGLEHKNDNGGCGEPPASWGAAALAWGCLPMTQNPPESLLTPADFVRHVTYVSGTNCHLCVRPHTQYLCGHSGFSRLLDSNSKSYLPTICQRSGRAHMEQNRALPRPLANSIAGRSLSYACSSHIL